MVSPKKKPKPKPKPVIEYPPLKLKKWVPPDQRKKPPPLAPAYVKPGGLTQKLAVSSLKKIWHNFSVIGDICVLPGHFSQSSKRFKPKTNNLQDACNCAVACAFSTLIKMANWSADVIDQILNFGDALYMKSLSQCNDKCKTIIKVEDVHPMFFFKDLQVKLKFSGSKIKKMLNLEMKPHETLIGAMERFFESYSSGIWEFRNQYCAIWKADTAMYFFNPRESEEDGSCFRGIPGDGVAVVIKCKSLKRLAQLLYSNIQCYDAAKFVIHPCSILKTEKMKVRPPPTGFTIREKEKCSQERQERPKESQKLIYRKSVPKVVELPPEVPKEVIDQIEEISPDVAEEISVSKRPSWLKDAKLTRQDIPKSRVPPLRPKNESVTFFKEFIPKMAGILRASRHLNDPLFARYHGRHELPMAVAALALLRIRKARRWTKQVLDDIMAIGNSVCRSTLKAHGNIMPDVNNLVKNISVQEHVFTADIEDLSVLGKIQSIDDQLVDMLTALDNFLRDYDCCIVMGPLKLAVWVENGAYYMFDPHERDEHGKRLVKTFASEPIGVGCVTWFKNIKDLVDLYINNIRSRERQDYFTLCKVKINDFVDIPDPWFNFLGLARTKWILRGTFSQNSSKFSRDSRNTQCTACATMALVFAKLKCEEEWNSNTVDEVLREGDSLYNLSVEDLKARNKFQHPMLLVDEVKRKFPVENKEVNLDIADCLVNGIVYRKDNCDVLDLQTGFETFFRDNEGGIVTAHNISVAVWKKEGIFYYYDSHSRDEKGVAASLGTACLLRILDIAELSRSLETNLGPSDNSTYNISRIVVNLLEKEESGIVKPPLNHFQELENLKAILRASISEKSSKFKLTRGKQTVPMCLIALAFQKLIPAHTWSTENIDKVLDMGDSYYVEVMFKLLDEGYFMRDELVDAVEGGGDEDEVAIDAVPNSEEKEDLITSVNIERRFKIGINLFEFELESIGEGTVESNLADTIYQYYGVENTELGVENEGDAEGENMPEPPPPDVDTQPEFTELLLETDTITISIWKDDKAYYLFDPKPRDATGQIIGKDDWSAKVEYPDAMEEYEGDMEEDHEKDVKGADVTNTEEELADEDYMKILDGEKGAGDMSTISAGATAVAPQSPPQDAARPVKSEQEGDIEPNEEGEEDFQDKEDVSIPVKEKHSSGYWRNMEEDGKACTMWFIKLSDLVNHIIENTPPNKRENMLFKLNVVKFSNTPDLKEVFNPQVEERISVFSGDWYNFKEIELGRWILRGRRCLDDPMYPAPNRGKQEIPSCLVFLCMVYAFALSRFSDEVLDGILDFGDRMYTCLSKMRKNELRMNVEGLTDKEIDEICENETYDLGSFNKEIYLHDCSYALDIGEDYLDGHILAKAEDKVLSLEKALHLFFESHRYGILQCKGRTVGLCRGEKIYYMFDPNKRGPSGIDSPVGVPCITRYMSLGKLVKTFKKNLPPVGKNIFVIHTVDIKPGTYVRQRQPVPEGVTDEDKAQGVEATAPEAVRKPESKPSEKITGYKSITPGKKVLRGEFSQEAEMFNRGADVQSAAMALLALGTSLVHMPKTWTKPIVNEIVLLGDKLYLDSLDALGHTFNPWADKLDIYRVKTDFQIGVVKINVELRHADKEGIIDVKNSDKLNLRQGLEKFFEDNTHGVLVTLHQTLAMWEEEEDDQTLIYLFDPAPRGPTGMPQTGGCAVCISFANAKLASSHIISCIGDPDHRKGPFIVVPVEMVAGHRRVGKKHKKSIATSKADTGAQKTLPRCDKRLLEQQKRQLRESEASRRKRKEQVNLQLLGRKGGYYPLSINEFILRALYSQDSERYPIATRGKQDIPNCIVACIMSRFVDIDKWSYDYIDDVLDMGNQLYIDSYVAYNKSRDPKLGLKNILRKFYMKKVEVEIEIYKLIRCEMFTPFDLKMKLFNIFNQEEYCMINYRDKWLAMIAKGGLWYVFVPHERDINGNKVAAGSKGTAVILRYRTLEMMCEKVFDMLASPEESVRPFELVSVSIKNYKKVKP